MKNCEQYIIIALSDRAKVIMMVIQLCIKILSNETHQPLKIEN
jgi:hypothetical protein